MATEVDELDFAGLYTVSMVAELLRVPETAVRRWLRREYLIAAGEVSRVAYVAPHDLIVARILAELHNAGCSLAAIDSKMAELTRLLPTIERPLADLPIVVEGHRILIRQGDDLIEPSGQLLLDFDAADASFEATEESTRVSIPLATWLKSGGEVASADGIGPPPSVESLRDLAAELESQSDLAGAIAVFRSIAISGAALAEDQFLLAELLYRCGDLTAARERYYMAIELAEDFAEARANLGCVLAELGDGQLAEAALRGALAFHESFADAHYHLARVLDNLGRADEATFHWQRFFDLAPHSPWIEEARDRLQLAE